MGIIINTINMNVNELVKDLFDKGAITKEEIIEFGKTCQLIILKDCLEYDDETLTYKKVKSNINILKSELVLDENKLHIVIFNTSLN